MYSDRFFRDLAKKVLVIDGDLVKPLSSMSRAFKYVRRGFSICPVGIARIAQAVQELDVDWENPDDNDIMFYPDGTMKFTGLD